MLKESLSSVSLEMPTYEAQIVATAFADHFGPAPHIWYPGGVLLNDLAFEKRAGKINNNGFPKKIYRFIGVPRTM